MINPRKQYEKQRDRLWDLIREYWREEENDRRKEQRRKVIRDKPTDRRKRVSPIDHIFTSHPHMPQ